MENDVKSGELLVPQAMPFTFELFVKAITEQYSKDSTRPGVQISFISERGDEGEWYVAVNRFTPTKVHILHVYNADLTAALRTAMRKFQRLVGGAPQNNLEQFQAAKL